MSKERYAEHTVAWELPNRDSVTKGNYNLADIETKYLPIQTEVVSYSKDQTINKLKQRIAELEEQLKNARKETAKKVIDRVEELSVFDFKAYEEHDLRKYTITELALDVILREYGEKK